MHGQAQARVRSDPGGAALNEIGGVARFKWQALFFAAYTRVLLMNWGHMELSGKPVRNWEILLQTRV